jgi:catechol 2,3-dioxygenase-like lactoylglutathione lyase family enzyme
MSAGIIALQHVNVRVSPDTGTASKEFYGTILGLEEVPKPEELRGRGGAWYQVGPMQLHLSVQNGVENRDSKRHICFLVRDLEACRAHLEAAGVEIFPDDLPTKGWPRFYVRDPGGNQIEIASESAPGR